MRSFDDYKDKFTRIKLRREDGILELRVHTDEGPLQWGPLPHEELALAFRSIAQDVSNKVVIITGTGDAFSGPRAGEGVKVPFHAMSPADWDPIHTDGMELMDSLLSIRVPVIAAVNGPAVRHCELALMSDIVLCSQTAEFQDSAHFLDGLTPGDGINVLTPLIMGLTRSRYFHLTGQIISAQQALDWGLVNEVLPRDAVLARAWDLARELTKQKQLVLRHTRMLFTQDLRKRMLDMVGYGLALEGLDVADARDDAAAH